MSYDDLFFLEHAYRLAEKGKGATSPNPRVGAVVVRNGEILGEGWHKKAGQPHAEVIALESAGEYSKGSTLYVNLEPCSTSGRTPPCTDAIIRAGITKVVAGCIDPNPKHQGRGFNILKNAGITVEMMESGKEYRKINEGFEKYIRTGIPFVTLKSAMSLDGKTATRTGESKWITCDVSRRHAHILRNESDAVMVGVGTVIKDNPRLNVRTEIEELHDPFKIVVDSQGKIPLESELLSPALAPGVILAAASGADETRLEKIKQRGAEVIICPEMDGKVDLNFLMKSLASRGIIYILVEGGAGLTGSLLSHGLIDKICFFYAPKLIGGNDAPGPVKIEGITRLEDSWKIYDMSVKVIGSDIFVEGYISK